MAALIGVLGSDRGLGQGLAADAQTVPAAIVLAAPPPDDVAGGERGRTNLFPGLEKARVQELGSGPSGGGASLAAPTGSPAGQAPIRRLSVGRAAAPTNELTEPLVLGPDGGGLPDMAADRFGRVHVVWQGPDFFIWYAQVGADGTITIPATKVYDTVKSTVPRIAVDDAGDAHVVFGSPGLTFTGVIYIKVSGGSRVALSVFSMFPLTGAFNFEQDSWPSIAINPVTQLPVVAADVKATYIVNFGFPSVPVTVWNEFVLAVPLDAAGSPVRDKLFVAYSVQGIPSPQYRAEYSSVAVDSLGTTHVVWVHRDPEWTSPSVGYARSGDDAWVEIANDRNVSGISGRPRIIAGESSAVEVVWSTTAGAAIWQELSHGGLTTVDDTIVSQPGAKGRWPGIASGFGNLVCAWTDSREEAGSQIYSRSLLEGLPEANVSESPATAFNSVVALPSADRVAFAYQDTRSGSNQIYYREHRTVLPEMADLVPTITFDKRDAHFLPGKPINVHVFIRNRGKQPARGTVLLELSLTQEGLASGSMLKLGEFSLPLDLESGQTVEWSRAIELVAGTAPPLDLAGSRRFVASLNRGHSVEEADYSNDEATSECFFMGEVINVVTHGFNLRPPDLLPVPFGEPWQTFHAPFYEIARVLDDVPEPGSVLSQNVHSEVLEWQSANGFWQAFVSLFIAEMAEAYVRKAADEVAPEKIVVLKLASTVLRKISEQAVPTARAEAETASHNFFRSRLNRRLLEDPEISRRFQRVNLIGHSRGAAVNATLSKLLFAAGYPVAEFVALDGFATDWPGDAGKIGDTNIVGQVWPSANRINYRVEQDIGSMLVDPLGADTNPFWGLFWDVFVPEIMPDLLAATKHPLAATIGSLLREATPTKPVRDYIRGLDLRAPERWGTENSPVVSGYDLKSNHLSIVELYRKNASLHAAKSFVGMNRQVGRCDSAFSDRFELPSVERIARQAVGASESSYDALSQFRDPTFEEVGEFLATATGLADLSSVDPVVDAWVRIVCAPQNLLSLSWATNGVAEFAASGGSSFAKLTQTTNTSITQLIQLLGGRKTVEFDLRAIAAGTADAIQVIVGDSVAGEIPLAVSGDFKRLSVRIDSFSDWKPVGFRLGGPAEVPSEVWLDNLAIVYEPPRIQRAERLPDGRVKLVIETVTGASFALDVSRDLQNWFERSIITATHDEVEHVEDFQEGTPALFYRLRSVSSEVGTR